MKRALILLLFLGFGLNGFSKKSKSPFYLEIPFKLEGHILVEADINGQKGYFIVDTGTPGGMIFSDALKAFKMPAENYLKGENIPFKKFKIQIQGHDFELNFGGNNRIERFVGRNYPVDKIFGILGNSFTSSHTITYDYIHQKIILEDAKYKKGSEAKLIDGFESQLLDIRFKKRFLFPAGHLYVLGCEVNGLEGEIHFDTGISGNQFSFDRSLAKKTGVDGNTIPKIKLGEMLWKDNAWFARNFRSVHKNEKLIGEIGNGMFFNCIVTVYPKQKKILIQRDNSMRPADSK